MSTPCHGGSDWMAFLTRTALRLLCLLVLACGGPLAHAAQRPVRITSPTNGALYLQPTNVPLRLQISIAVTNDFNAPTDLFDGTNFLGSTALQEHDLLTWSNVAFGDHELVAIHRRPAGDETSSVVRVRVEYGGWAMLPPGSVWYYRDGGVNLGTAWRGTNVDISAWPQGPAKLGFGDDDVVTWLNGYNSANGQLFPTYYFRHTFNATNPAAHSNLAVRLRRDDAAIVYLNGDELLRDNLPASDVTYQTYALSGVPDETEFAQYWMNPARLRAGTNHLAVEIHNAGPLNGDIGFDLALVADIPVPPPALDVQRATPDVLITWPAGYAGYRLETAPALAPGGSTWAPVTNPPAMLPGQIRHTQPATNPQQFFRLKLD